MTDIVDDLVKIISSEAIKEGGATWTKVKATMPLYLKGYAQTLAEIAKGVRSGDITKPDGRMYAENAKLLLQMGVANTAEILLNEIQVFLNKVIAAVSGALQKALGVAIL